MRDITAQPRHPQNCLDFSAGFWCTLRLTHLHLSFTRNNPLPGPSNSWGIQPLSAHIGNFPKNA